jgi:hypothetical protein
MMDRSRIAALDFAVACAEAAQGGGSAAAGSIAPLAHLLLCPTSLDTALLDGVGSAQFSDVAWILPQLRAARDVLVAAHALSGALLPRSGDRAPCAARTAERIARASLAGTGSSSSTAPGSGSGSAAAASACSCRRLDPERALVDAVESVSAVAPALASAWAAVGYAHTLCGGYFIDTLYAQIPLIAQHWAGLDFASTATALKTVLSHDAPEVASRWATTSSHDPREQRRCVRVLCAAVEAGAPDGVREALVAAVGNLDARLAAEAAGDMERTRKEAQRLLRQLQQSRAQQQQQPMQGSTAAAHVPEIAALEEMLQRHIAG